MSEQAVPVWRLPDGELAQALLVWEQEARQRYVSMLEMVAEAERRGLAAALGYRDSVALLGETLRISPREARARVTHAAATVDTAATSGAEIAAPIPETGAALADGDIGPEHVTEIHKVMSEVSGLVDEDAHGRAEHDLVELARQANPAAVRKLGRHLLAYLDQDGKPPEESGQAEPYREFAWHYARSGWMRFTGRLDPESAAQLEGLFGALAKPEPADAAGRADARSPQQRQGDALAEVIDLAARADELSTQGGERAVLTVTVPLSELRQHAKGALFDLPGITGAEGLRRLACQAKIIPAVLGTDGEPLDIGRAARLATGAQRRALVLRDGGCAFLGCDRTPKWTTAHHIRRWVDGGPTDMRNLVLLCARHHRRIHHSEWEVAMRRGRPEFYPPGWIDPDRTPRHNRAHAPPGRSLAA